MNEEQAKQPADLQHLPEITYGPLGETYIRKDLVPLFQEHFKEGDLVTVNKPDDAALSSGPSWSPEMDKFDGTLQCIRKVHLNIGIQPGPPNYVEPRLQMDLYTFLVNWTESVNWFKFLENFKKEPQSESSGTGLAFGALALAAGIAMFKRRKEKTLPSIAKKAKIAHTEKQEIAK